MDVVRLRVEATRGVRVRVGQSVEKGVVIGWRGENEVAAERPGVVESIEFDGERHEFEVAIRTE
jgi:biotin carboxyl carrier protein